MPEIIPANTAEWIKARVGCLTASSMRGVLAVKKNGEPTAEYEKLVNAIVGERLSGMARNNYVSPAMQWGIETEERAVEAYQAATGELCDEAGFILHPSIPHFGASPDRFVGDDGLIEVKCPETSTHVQYLRDGVPPEDYLPQMWAQLAVTGRKWCDFVSFDPRINNPQCSLFIVRVERDDQRIHDIEAAAQAFLVVVRQTIEQLTRKVA